MRMTPRTKLDKAGELEFKNGIRVLFDKRPNGRVSYTEIHPDGFSVTDTCTHNEFMDMLPRMSERKDV